VILSNNSPLGVKFHYLKGTTSDLEKKKRIDKGTPGSPCTEKHLVNNTEFTKEPICTASTKYQKLKINQLKTMNLQEEEYEKELQKVLDKECLCVGLSNSAALNYDTTFLKNLPAVTICPGPNIVFFSKKVSLREMTDHIYGRSNLIEDEARPHMFINELFIYIKYLKEELSEAANKMDAKKEKYFAGFKQQLMNGINYYRQIPLQSNGFSKKIENFYKHLNAAEIELEAMFTSNLIATE
jgi:hypothetical protein